MVAYPAVEDDVEAAVEHLEKVGKDYLGSILSRRLVKLKA